MASSLSVLALLLSCISVCEGFYFFVKVGAPRCFVDEVPPDTAIMGSYTAPDSIETAGLKLDIMNPEGTIVYSQNCDLEGRFIFTSTEGGEYRTCLSANTTVNFFKKDQRATLVLQGSEEATDYEALATKRHLDEIGVRVVRVTDQVKAILSELEYIKEREVAFREATDSANGRVAYWSIFQIVVMVVSCLWQVKNLQTFFRAKKLV